MASSTNDKWLVKSSDRVIGPHSFDEVHRRLLQKELTIFDEVMMPLGRWKYFRDEPAFAASVEEVRRNLLSAREDTEVQLTTTDAEATVSLHEMNIGERDVSSPSASGADRTDAEVKSYGTMTKRADGASPQRQALTLGAVALCGILAAFVLVNFVQGRSTSHRTQISEVLAEARKARDLGRVQDALRLYKQASEVRDRTGQSMPPQAELDWAYLRLINSDERVEARRVAEAVLSRRVDRGSEVAAQNLLALVSIRSGDLSDAKRILKADISLSFAAVFNLASIYFREGDFPRAVQTIRPTVQGSNPFPEAEFLLVLILTEWSRTQPEVRREAMDMARRLIEIRSAYEFDAAVLLAWMSTFEKSQEATAKALDLVLSRDPQLLEGLIYAHAIDPTAVAPSVIMDFCRDLKARRPSEETTAILGLCQMREGDGLAGLETLEAAVSVRPQDSRLLAIKALGLGLVGREQEAASLLRLASGAEPRSVLADILLSNQCLERVKSSAGAEIQVECQKLFLQIPVAPESVASSVLLFRALVLVRQDKLSDARSILSLLNSRHTNWRPLAELLGEIR